MYYGVSVQTLKPKLTNIKQRIQQSPATLRGSMYDYAWQQRRDQHLRHNPLCVYCQRQGYVRLASVADHITPHRGDAKLFAGELQSLCATCHSSVKQKEEHGTI